MEKSEKLERLFLLYEQPMYRVAYSILNSVWQAEDAVSLAFVKLSENIDRIDEPESEKTKRYVKKIIRNTSIDLYRKNKRESKYLKSSDEKYESVRDDKVEMDFHNIENEGNFKSLLDGLSEKYKEILMMRCVQEMSFSEIAAVVEEKPATVRKQYERAKKTIKTKLMEDDVYEDRRKVL